MRFKIKKLNFEWHRWFAWHPVEVGDEWVWLEYVQRRWGCRWPWLYEYKT